MGPVGHRSTLGLMAGLAKGQLLNEQAVYSWNMYRMRKEGISWKAFTSLLLLTADVCQFLTCIPWAVPCHVLHPCSDHMLCGPNLLPYSAHPCHIQRELFKGCASQVWFGSCVIPGGAGCPLGGEPTSNMSTAVEVFM
jgi:hypothetical protein